MIPVNGDEREGVHFTQKAGKRKRREDGKTGQEQANITEEKE